MKKMKMKLSALAAVLLAASPALADQASVTQNGYFGTAQVNQTGGTNNANDAEVLQDIGAWYETAAINQAGAGDQTAYIYQNGVEDHAAITQNGSLGNASVYQGYDSYDGNANITQDVNSVGAIATIYQNYLTGYGYYNNASIYQNSAGVDQATITQVGDSNTATTTQQDNTGAATAALQRSTRRLLLVNMLRFTRTLAMRRLSIRCLVLLISPISARLALETLLT